MKNLPPEATHECSGGRIRLGPGFGLEVQSDGPVSYWEGIEAESITTLSMLKNGGASKRLAPSFPFSCWSAIGDLLKSFRLKEPTLQAGYKYLPDATRLQEGLGIFDCHEVQGMGNQR